jgi:hypothetical protein
MRIHQINRRPMDYGRYPAIAMGLAGKADAAPTTSGNEEGGLWHVLEVALGVAGSVTEAAITDQRADVADNYYDQTTTAPVVQPVAEETTIGGLAISPWMLVAGVGVAGLGLFLLLK